jgi:uncharacterized protein (TIGR03083 family)
MDRTTGLGVLDREGRKVVDILGGCQDPTRVDVVTCPGWTLTDLADHLGGVYGWVVRVLESPPDAARPEWPPGRKPEEPVARFFASRLEALLSALHEVDEDSVRWNFVADDAAPVSFWWRRQLHETVIHRVDAELAVGTAVTSFDTKLSVDGIDEYFEINSYRPADWSDLQIGDGLAVHLHATDTDNAEWTVDTLRGRFARAHMKGDVGLRAPAWSLDRWLWGRFDLADGEIFGDRTAAEYWRPRP